MDYMNFLRYNTRNCLREYYKMPSSAGLKPEIRECDDGSIIVQYKPSKSGTHEVQMSYEGSATDGSPFSCVVDEIAGAYVTAFGEGLVGGMSGQDQTFTITAKKGTLNDININIDGPTKTDYKRQDHGDRCDVTFMPMTPGAYNITIKYKNKEIKGSPFVSKVSGEGRKRSQVSLGNASEYALNVMEPDIVDLVGSIKSPSGHWEPCILKKSKDGHLCVSSFSPKVAGEYSVQVYRNERNIKGSPFSVNVKDSDIAHASRVNTTGAVTDALANESNIINVDASQAGYGGITMVIEGPHRSEIDFEETGNRCYKVAYSPHEPGIYILNIRFADEHVKGSPFLLNVGGKPSGRSRETIEKEMVQAEPVKKGTKCEFLLKIPGTNPFDMEASVTDPSGTTELCEIIDEDDFHYRMNFTAHKDGLHTLSIKHKALHISGSPFQYSVGQLSSGGYHKVQVGGPGVEKGECKKENHFNIYTREAGAGTLSLGIEGPSPAKIILEERPNGFLGATYKVEKPGMYGIHCKFNEEHIPNSPFMVNIAPDSGIARTVTVHALKDRGLAVDKAQTFTVSYNGARGRLHAYLRTPSGGHEDCFVQEMDEGIYAIRYIPKENGVHYIDIKLDDHHIPDSPFAVMVGSTAADPAMVHALGEGLEMGKVGAKNKFVVKTAGAGSGFLALTIDGPSKVALSCKEVDEGYEFSYTPFSSGKYMIAVKYGNINIAGSPYVADVTVSGGAGRQRGFSIPCLSDDEGFVRVGAGRKPSPVNEQSTMVVETVEKQPGAKSLARFKGDAGRVTVRGPGLKKPMTNRLTSFTVDVKEAGYAMLMVGMVAPSGLAEPELGVKKNTKTEYTVSYKVQEVGDHTLVIKYGDEDIPGSPFVLHCT